MNPATIFVISLGIIILFGLLAVLLGPMFGWQIAARNAVFIPFTSRVEARANLREAFSAQGWEVERDEPDEMTARTKPSWRSWGEVVKVKFEDSGATVTSECALPTQAVDYGKNKINLRKLVESLSKNNV
ncbi:hypothetical protein KP003_06810 [Geomonas nitrogeniifigens]|uniref:DUF1499 domain-containing protein n=1 Tax=Geomonas oryzisoli TaxID=2847992 RepID=A0ABX8J532_9BACT|nr:MULTISPECIES: hypothetical protein [Geomonas]QWV93565.1 hypothetical protein KP004_20800 [Geomonas oryzisoli]QXE88102.1 hypothetical protein KP003_06810 [Geomonas nitrogeniifigens]